MKKLRGEILPLLSAAILSLNLVLGGAIEVPSAPIVEVPISAISIDRLNISIDIKPSLEVTLQGSTGD